MKRVLMVISNFYPQVGGTEKQCFQLSKSLAANKMEVDVLTRSRFGDNREVIDSFTIIRKGVFGPLWLDSLIFMMKVFFYILTAKKYDIVHSHMMSSFSLSVIAASKLKNCKTVFSVSGGKDLNEFSMSKSGFLGRLKITLLKNSRLKVLVKNIQTAKWLKEEGFLNWDIKLFKNAVDTAQYKIAFVDEKQKAKQKIGAFGRNILFVGRLAKEKRIEEFMEVFAEIMSERNLSDVNLLIVGDGPLKGAIEEAVKALNLSGKVFIFGQQYDLKDYYDAAEIFVLPSISEGMSNSMLEAMSSGLLILASNVGGAAELVKENENGCLFEPLNKNQLKNCLNKVLSCPDIKQVGENNRRIITERFSLAVVVKELLLIYED